MKNKLLVSLLLFLLTFTCFGQATKVYQVGNSSVIDRGSRDVYISPGGLSVDFNVGTGKITVRNSKGVEFSLFPFEFLSQSGAVYGPTLNSAIGAWMGYVQSVGNSGTVSVTPNYASFGSNVPTNTPVTSNVTVNTTGAIHILIENTGTTDATFTYGGLSYVLEKGRQRQFPAILDQTTNKYSPYATLTIQGSASATVYVTITKAQ